MGKLGGALLAGQFLGSEQVVGFLQHPPAEKLTRLQRWAVQTAAWIGHNKAAMALANELVRIC